MRDAIAVLVCLQKRIIVIPRAEGIKENLFMKMLLKNVSSTEDALLVNALFASTDSTDETALQLSFESTKTILNKLKKTILRTIWHVN